MNNQANITRIEHLSGHFALVHLKLDHAAPGELVYFTGLDLQLASLPIQPSNRRLLLCMKSQLPAANTAHNVILSPLPTSPFDIIVGHNNGMAAAISLGKQHRSHQPLVLLATDDGFPFKPAPSSMLVSNMPDGIIAASPLLDDWGIASRLASEKPTPGCYHGTAGSLLSEYLSAKKQDDSNICLAGSENFINNVNLNMNKYRCHFVKL
jgi:hypothetical protein